MSIYSARMKAAADLSEVELSILCCCFLAQEMWLGPFLRAVPWFYILILRFLFHLFMTWLKAACSNTRYKITRLKINRHKSILKLTILIDGSKNTQNQKAHLKKLYLQLPTKNGKEGASGMVKGREFQSSEGLFLSHHPLGLC